MVKIEPIDQTEFFENARIRKPKRASQLTTKRTGSNKNMNRAQRLDDDEWYTLRETIEFELQHYPGAFRGKVVYCNCDDPRQSEFFKYFADNFARLGLKKLITSCYKSLDDGLFSNHDSERAVWIEYDGTAPTGKNIGANEINVKTMKGDGDFRSKESIALLEQADIVVTNPPFSLTPEFVMQLVKYKKDFIIIGNFSSYKYKNIWPLMQSGKVRFGASKRNFSFINPNGIIEKKNAIWFTTLAHTGIPRALPLTKKYHPDDYPKFDNLDAIRVKFVSDIPYDYYGKIGVTETYFYKHDPCRFQIIGMSYELVQGGKIFFEGKEEYSRIIIQRTGVDPEEDERKAIALLTQKEPTKQSRNEMLEQLIGVYGLKCQGCFWDKPKDDLQLDHVKARSKGGADTIDNMLPLCGKCNQIKSNKMTIDQLRRENEARGRMAWQIGEE